MSSVIGGYRVYLYVKADARGSKARVRVPEWQASATKTTFSAFRPASRNHWLSSSSMIRSRVPYPVLRKPPRISTSSFPSRSVPGTRSGSSCEPCPA